MSKKEIPQRVGAIRSKGLMEPNKVLRVEFEMTDYARNRGANAAMVIGSMPELLSRLDPRPAREQLHERYAYGGGWFPYNKFRMKEGAVLAHDGDPDMHPLAMAWLRDERIYIYEYSWINIVQKDGSFEVARMS